MKGHYCGPYTDTERRDSKRLLCQQTALRTGNVLNQLRIFTATARTGSQDSCYSISQWLEVLFVCFELSAGLLTMCLHLISRREQNGVRTWASRVRKKLFKIWASFTLFRSLLDTRDNCFWPQFALIKKKTFRIFRCYQHYFYFICVFKLYLRLFERNEFNPLRTRRIGVIQGLSAYRAVNTLRLCYTNQSVNVV